MTARTEAAREQSGDVISDELARAASCHDIYPWSRANDILAGFGVSAKLEVQARLTVSSPLEYSAHTYAVYFISFLYSASDL